MRYAMLPLIIVGIACSIGCAVSREVGEPPLIVSYEEWAMRMAEISEIVEAESLCEAGLERHRNAQVLENKYDIYDELTMAIRLFAQSADQYYLAWERYPSYEKFILLELDKVYGYVNACVMQRPYYFDPTDPLDVYGGALTYEQRQMMVRYRTKLRKWQETSGQ